MKRLTKRTSDGWAYLVNVKPNERDIRSPYPNTLECVLETIQKLAEYEDTGLTPEEIANLNTFEKTQCAKLFEENCKLKQESTYWKREALKWANKLGEIKIKINGLFKA